MKTHPISDALKALDPYYPSLLQQAHRLCRDADQAQDLTRDTLYHAAEHIHAFRGNSLRAWLGTSLRNRFLDNYRHPRPIALDALDKDILPARELGPEAETLSLLLTQDILDHCHDPRLFQAVALEGESLTDFARRTGENLNTVTARWRRERQRLQAYFTSL